MNHAHTRPRRPSLWRRIPKPLRLPALLLPVVALLLAVLVLRPMPASPPPGAPEWVKQALLDVNDYSRPGTPLDGVNGIVIHYTGNPGTTARQNRDYFASLALTHETYASSNFIVDLNGDAIQTVPSDEVAYCSSQRNHDTLSIEVCHPDESGVFTEASTEALVRLVQWLVDYNHLTRAQILRHYDVTGKECPRHFVEDPAAWEAFLDRILFP